MANISPSQARRAGENLFEQGKRPVLAMMGAGDYVMAQVREQMRDLPVNTQAALRQFPDTMRSQMNSWRSQARSTYLEMAERGEHVGERMAGVVRSQPMLRTALGGIADAFDSVEDTIEDVIDEDGRSANGSRSARTRSSGSSSSASRSRRGQSGQSKPRGSAS